MINLAQLDSSSVNNQSIKLRLDIELLITVNPESNLNRTLVLSERQQETGSIHSNNKSLEEIREIQEAVGSDKEQQSMLSFGDYSGKDVERSMERNKTSFSQFKIFPTVDGKDDVLREDKNHSNQSQGFKRMKRQETEDLEKKNKILKKPVTIGNGHQLYIPKTLYNSRSPLLPFKQAASDLNFSNSNTNKNVKDIKELEENRSIKLHKESQNTNEILKKRESIEESPFLIKLGPIIPKDTTQQKNLLDQFEKSLSRESTRDLAVEQPVEWVFQNLVTFLEEYYLQYNLHPEIILRLNPREKIILIRLLNTNFKNKKRAFEDQTFLQKLACDFFNKQPNQHKGYKVTNSKRFIYRKIKTVLYQNFKNGKFRKHLSKKALDNEFFEYYFSKAPEYQTLCPEEREAIKTLYFTYEETKIHLLWRFKIYKRNFTAILLNFKEEMQKYYFNQKVRNLKHFLESIHDRSEQDVKVVKLPFASLPLTHQVVDLYVSDFVRSFGDNLNN